MEGLNSKNKNIKGGGSLKSLEIYRLTFEVRHCVKSCIYHYKSVCSMSRTLILSINSLVYKIMSYMIIRSKSHWPHARSWRELCKATLCIVSTAGYNFIHKETILSLKTHCMSLFHTYPPVSSILSSTFNIFCIFTPYISLVSMCFVTCLFLNHIPYTKRKGSEHLDEC